MNENLNLVEILKDCPRGTKLYSTVFGEVKFMGINENAPYPIIVKVNDENFDSFTADGKILLRSDGECIIFPSKEQRDWSKFTAPWLKNERYNPSVLSNSSNTGKNEQKSDDKVEPKFKVGNWYQCTKSFYGKGVIFTKNTAYYCAQKGCLQDEYGCHIAIVKDLYDNFKLWTIQDAKDGDVLANDHHILILKELVYDWSSNGTPYSVKAYCGIKPNGNFEIGKDNWCFCGTLHIHPATKEQRDVLMKAMNDAGYVWDEKKNELRELIKPKFDPKTLQPFDKVLVRDKGLVRWRCTFYSHLREDNETEYKYVTAYNIYRYCIPYNDDTKHLVGTTEEAPEFYRYWED